MRLGALSAMAAGGTLVHPAEDATLVTEDGLATLLLRLAIRRVAWVEEA